MIFKLQQLKKFLLSIKDNKINYIHIINNELKITINKKYFDLSIKSNPYTKNNKNNLINTRIKSINQNDYQIENSSINTVKNHKVDELENYSTIVSPMVGTFYRSPAPNEPVFIEKNDIVKKQQTVCIIEAMKLMNEIESEVNGEIIEIMVKDGDIVDCGQALMKVKII